MAEYTIKSGQSIYDVALQLYGNAGKAFKIVQDNRTVLGSILERNLFGKTITYTPQTDAISSYFSSKGVIIATDFPKINTLSAFSSAFSSSFPTSTTL